MKCHIYCIYVPLNHLTSVKLCYSIRFLSLFPYVTDKVFECCAPSLLFQWSLYFLLCNFVEWWRFGGMHMWYYSRTDYTYGCVLLNSAVSRCLLHNMGASIYWTPILTCQALYICYLIEFGQFSEVRIFISSFPREQLKLNRAMWCLVIQRAKEKIITFPWLLVTYCKRKPCSRWRVSCVVRGKQTSTAGRNVRVLVCILCPNKLLF